MSEKQQPPQLQQQPYTDQPSSLPQPTVNQGPAWPTTQQLLPVQQQPVVIQVISSNQPVIYDKYNSKRSRALGITQIVMGAAAVIFNIIGIVVNTRRIHEFDYYYPRINVHYSWYDTTAYYVGTGFWCTILCILSGSFAICTARRKTRCLIITHLIFAILGSIFAFIMFAHACWAVGHDASRLERGFSVSGYNYDNQRLELSASKSEAKAKGVIVLSVLFLLVSIGEIIASIWSCTLCCKVLCCAVNTGYTAPSVQYVSNPAGQQMIMMSNQVQTVAGAGMIQTAGSGNQVQPGVVQPPMYGTVVSEQTLAMGAVGQQTYPAQQGDDSKQIEPGTPPPAYQ